MEDPQIQALIVRYLSGEASPDQESELLDWVSIDPSHKVYFDEWKSIWENQRPANSPFNLNRGLDRLDKAITNSERKRGVKGWQRIAASVSILTLISFATYFIVSRNNSSTLVTFREVRTDAGQRTTYSLPDGSLVTLNGNSSFRYPAKFENNMREVFLAGEGFFQVSKDSQRPFIIHSGHLTTEVLGTSFNVLSSMLATEVTVASGKVKVTAGDASEILGPREKIVYKVEDKRMIKLQSNLEELAWKDNVIIFKDASMQYVAKTLQAFYGMSIRFENDELKKCLITGKFENKPIDIVLSALSFSTGIHYKVSGDTITLSGAGCE